MSKNTVLGYLKGYFQLFLLFSYESLKRLAAPYIRYLVSINTLAGRPSSRYTIHIYCLKFLFFSYVFLLLKAIFYKSDYSVLKTLFYKTDYNVPSHRPTTTPIQILFIYIQVNFKKFHLRVYNIFQGDSYISFSGPTCISDHQN